MSVSKKFGGWLTIACAFAFGGAACKLDLGDLFSIQQPDAGAVADASMEGGGNNDATVDGGADNTNGDGGGSAGDAASPPLAKFNDKSPLGTNLSAPFDYYTEIHFVDVFKASRPWISGTETTFDDMRTIATDTQGNIASLEAGQYARTLMLWDIGDKFPGGKYTVLYDGDASGVEYGGGATKNAAESQSGRDVLDVEPKNGGIQMLIKSLSPDNKLRNVRVIMPGGTCSNDQLKMCASDATCGDGNTCALFVDTYATQVYNPAFLDTIKRNKIIRFMDWLNTNNSTLAHWSDRPHVEDARWSVKGVPLEIALDLANRVNADAWVNVPHLADDDFIQQMGALVASRLRPDLKAYVEYSNEVWNFQFQQGQYAFQQGKALGYGPTDFETLIKYESKRTVDVAKAWTAIFGADAPKRLVRVMGAQAANSFVADTTLGFNDAASSIDAVAIAPYFGGYLGTPDKQTAVDAMNADALFSELDATALPEAIGWMNDNATIAKKYNVKMVAYEGGQHLVGVQGVENDDVISALFDTVNRDARMGVVYTKYLNAWKSSGGDQFVSFVNCGMYNKFGRWGALEYLSEDRTSAPKYQALDTFITSNPTP